MAEISKELATFRDALLRTGYVREVWHLAEDGDIRTALCRPTGSDAADKELRMEQLARLLLPVCDGTVLIARQFSLRGGKFGYTWNVSAFGDAALLAIEAVAPNVIPKPTAVVKAVPTSTPSNGKISHIRKYRGAGLVRGIWTYPLPHVMDQDRNAPNEKGKGATLVSAKRK